MVSTYQWITIISIIGRDETMHNHSVGLIVFYNFGYATKQDTLIMFQVNGRRTVEYVYFSTNNLRKYLLQMQFFLSPSKLQWPWAKLHDQWWLYISYYKKGNVAAFLLVYPWITPSRLHQQRSYNKHHFTWRWTTMFSLYIFCD